MIRIILIIIVVAFLFAVGALVYFVVCNVKSNEEKEKLL